MQAGFWVLEGIDGCGKSTQAKLLCQSLEAAGRHPLHLREPGSTALGEGLRRLLLEPGRSDWDARAEALVFFAARRELLLKEIRPALAAGRDVVCERFTGSTYAYQGQASPSEAKWVLELDRLVVGQDQPHLHLILDLNPQESFARVGREAPKDAFETRGVAFQQKVREAYLRFAKEKGPAAAVLQVGGRSIEDIAQEVSQAVEQARP